MMEVVLAPSKLDELFEQTAKTGYTRELLFSTLVMIMTNVVCGMHQSIGSVYKALSAEIGVSKTAVYDKLNRLEPSVSRALVQSTAQDLATIISDLGGEPPELLPGYRVKILDGNALGATDHRLEVLADTSSGALPGKSLVVLDPALGLAIDVFPCEDGHTQERALLPKVLETVEAGDLWIGDRNFCTTGFLFGIENRQAAFILRQHLNLPWQAISELVEVGRTEGGMVFSQTGIVAYNGQTLLCRRIVVKLDQPTRDGETFIALLTNLPPYGIFLPEAGELFLFFVQSKLTADCIVDLLEDWWLRVKDRFSHIRKIVINQDNGPENNSRRTQFMFRILEFAQKFQLTIQLAYYPPYHSKYNPVERAFGWLEQHWSGSLLDSVDTVLKFASTLTFKGKNPLVTLVDRVYCTGVKLTTEAMAEVEKQIQRLPNLKKWFVEIFGSSA